MKCTIDGIEAGFGEGATILQVARSAGIDIPTLCHVEGAEPHGACRICAVEIEGARALAGACHTPAADGMVIYTRSPKVLDSRKVNIELLLASHTGDCVNDSNAWNCRLHLMASEVQAGPPRFLIRNPRYYPAEEENHFVRRDLSKCILCRACVEACRSIAGKNLLSVAYRGGRCKIVAGFDEVLASGECEGCRACIDRCPTGALTESGSHVRKEAV